MFSNRSEYRPKKCNKTSSERSERVFFTFLDGTSSLENTSKLKKSLVTFICRSVYSFNEIFCWHPTPPTTTKGRICKKVQKKICLPLGSNLWPFDLVYKGANIASQISSPHSFVVRHWAHKPRVQGSNLGSTFHFINWRD